MVRILKRPQVSAMKKALKKAGYNFEGSMQDLIKTTAKRGRGKQAQWSAVNTGRGTYLVSFPADLFV